MNWQQRFGTVASGQQDYKDERGGIGINRLPLFDIIEQMC